MLYLVGLGLSPLYLTEEARRILMEVEEVLLDAYTNVLTEEEIAEYESMVGRTFYRASRTDLEDGMVEIVERARERDIAIAVSGDPLTATTHISLYTEALKRGVSVKYVPGVSIHTVSMSLSGLQHYRFGPVITVPHRWRESPSFYERLARNKKTGVHSLLLLDLHPVVTLPEALEAILYWEREKKRRVLELGDLVIGIARAGKKDCFRRVGTVEELLDTEWGDPPHSLIVPGELHPIEEEVLYTIRRYGDGEC